jgi:hypothetical protein
MYLSYDINGLNIHNSILVIQQAEEKGLIRLPNVVPQVRRSYQYVTLCMLQVTVGSSALFTQKCKAPL